MGRTADCIEHEFISYDKPNKRHTQFLHRLLEKQYDDTWFGAVFIVINGKVQPSDFTHSKGYMLRHYGMEELYFGRVTGYLIKTYSQIRQATDEDDEIAKKETLKDYNALVRFLKETH